MSADVTFPTPRHVDITSYTSIDVRSERPTRSRFNVKSFRQLMRAHAGEWRTAQLAMAMQSLDGDSRVPGAAVDAAAVSLTGRCLRARAAAAGRGCAAPIDCQQVLHFFTFVMQVLRCQ